MGGIERTKGQDPGTKERFNRLKDLRTSAREFLERVRRTDLQMPVKESLE